MSIINTTIQKTEGYLKNVVEGGINKLTGTKTIDTPLYEQFYNSILTDVNNAVTESSYWVVFFAVDDDFNKGAKRRFRKLEPTKWTMSDKTDNATKSFIHSIPDTIMLVQGIEIPGDGFSISRQGADNIGGFIKPALTGVRNDMPELEITFLENNSSVTDLVLRPWVIHSSYASLKFAKKATITCHNLTRSPTGFKVRKAFTFHDAVPMSIDAEQYDYTAMSSYGKRQTKFAFSHYTMTDGVDLEEGFMDKIKDFAVRKIRNAADRVIETGVDIVGGAVNQVYTNIKGQFVDNVEDAVQNLQSKLRDYGQNAESSIIDNSQRIIDKAFGVSVEKDHLMRGLNDFPTSGTPDNPSPRINVNTKSNDALISPPIPPKSSGITNNAKYTLTKINTDDTPDTKTLNIQEVNVNN